MLSETRGTSSWSPIEPACNDGSEQAILEVEPVNEDGVLTMKARGTWTDLDFHRHFAVSEHELAKVRAQASTVRFLGDLRDTRIETEAGGGGFNRNVTRLFRPGDRIAFVVRTSFEKSRLRRTLAGGNAHFFLSMDCARMWLGTAA